MFLSRFFILLSSLGFFTLSFAAAVPRDWNEKYHHPPVLVPQSYYEVLRLRSTAFLNSRFIATNIVCLDRSKYVPLFIPPALSIAEVLTIAQENPHKG